MLKRPYVGGFKDKDRTIARNRNAVAGLIVCLTLSACITRPHVTTQVAEDVRLEQYLTYALQAGEIYDSRMKITSPSFGIGPVLEANIRSELERRGLRPSDHQPDLTFRYVAGRRLRQTNESWPMGNSDEWTYQEGAVDLVAKDSAGRTVWRSHLQAVIDPSDKTRRQLKEAIAEAFKNYPTVRPRG